MKTLRLLIALVTVSLLTVPAFAQTTISSTTLSAAIGSPTASSPTPTTVINLTACTSCAADWLIYVDLEAMRITRAFVAGSVSNIPVLRGQDGTRAAPHSNAAVVYYGPATRFHGAAGAGLVAGDPPAGRCVRADQQFLPWINIFTGWTWVCDNVNWRVTIPYSITSNSR